MEVVEISGEGGLTRELAIGSWVFDGWLPSAVSDQYCESTTHGFTQSCTTELHVNEDGTVVLETWDRNRERHTQSGMWALSSGGSLIISPNESSDIVELKLIDQNTDGSFMISVEGASEHLLGYTDTYLNLNKFSRLEHAVKREPQDSDYLANWRTPRCSACWLRLLAKSRGVSKRGWHTRRGRFLHTAFRG